MLLCANAQCDSISFVSVAKMSLRCMELALHSCIAALYADVSIVVGGGLVGKICSEGVD